jgi:hypothetical protein
MWSFDSKQPKRLAGAWRTKESYLVWKMKGKTAKSKMMTFARCSTCFYLCLDAPFDLLRVLTVEPCFLRFFLPAGTSNCRKITILSLTK